MPPECALPMQMQSLELKPTDLWQYLLLPSRFIDIWNITRGVVHEFQKEMMDSDSG